jgi:hypothetical protein
MTKDDLKQKPLIAGKKQVSTIYSDINLDQLHFYPKNPRIASLLPSNQKKLSDDEIHKLMYEGKPETVKTLYRSVLEDGVVIEPLIVYENKVLEGNTRLWVLRELYSKTNEKKWFIAPCRVIKDKLSDEEINFLLAHIHLTRKKKDWDPYEQAAWIAELIEKEKLSIKKVNEMSRLSPQTINLYLKVYKKMRELNIPAKDFSIYLETYKDPEVEKTEKKMKIDLTKIIKDKVESGLLKGAANHGRKVGLVLKSAKTANLFLNTNMPFEKIQAIAVLEHPEAEDTMLKRISDLTMELNTIKYDKLQEIGENETKKKIIADLAKKINAICKQLKIKL